MAFLAAIGGALLLATSAWYQKSGPLPEWARRRAGDLKC
jgi:hypothetical protein